MLFAVSFNEPDGPVIHIDPHRLERDDRYHSCAVSAVFGRRYLDFCAKRVVTPFRANTHELANDRQILEDHRAAKANAKNVCAASQSDPAATLDLSASRRDWLETGAYDRGWNTVLSPRSRRWSVAAMAHLNHPSS